MTRPSPLERVDGFNSFVVVRASLARDVCDVVVAVSTSPPAETWLAIYRPLQVNKTTATDSGLFASFAWVNGLSLDTRINPFYLRVVVQSSLDVIASFLARK